MDDKGGVMNLETCKQLKSDNIVDEIEPASSRKSRGEMLGDNMVDVRC